MKKLLWTIVFLLTLTPTFASKLTIGCPPLNPPFGELADGQNHFLGFDIDIMMEICSRLDTECTFKPIIFNNLLPALNSGMIDLAVSGVIITPERKADALFSLPYMESNARFMGLVSSTIAAPKDIAGKTVGTRQGTPFMELALQLYNGNVQSKEYALTADLLEALKNKEFDVALLDNQAAKYWVGNNSDVYKLIGTPIPIGEGYGIMTSKNNGDLIQQINKALMDMESDGTYLIIYSRYFSKQFVARPMSQRDEKNQNPMPSKVQQRTKHASIPVKNSSPRSG